MNDLDLDELEQEIREEGTAEWKRPGVLLGVIGRVRKAEAALANREVEFAAVLSSDDFVLTTLRAEFRDTTELVDITPFGRTDHTRIEGVRGFSLTIQSTGEQPLTPAELLYWFEKHKNGGTITLRVTS